MTTIRLLPLDRPDVEPLSISARMRSQLVYFANERGADKPPLAPGEFYFAADQIATTLDDGVLCLVSPLDTANMTEIELSEEQEEFLEWLRDHSIQIVRVQE